MEGNDKYSKEYKQHVSRIFELFNYNSKLAVHTRDFDLKMINRAIQHLLKND